MFQIANKGDIKRNKNGSPQNEGTNLFNKLKKNYCYFCRRFLKPPLNGPIIIKKNYRNIYKKYVNK